MTIPILIRCTKNDRYVDELISKIQNGIPNAIVFAVPDFTGLSAGEAIQEAKKFSVPTLPITKEFLSEFGLGYYGKRTGWRCGDYVLYRALSIDWERAWVIEPDVAFLNGAERIFAAFENSSADLVCRMFRKAKEGWWWRKGMQALKPDLPIFGMEFGMFRVSRELATEAFKLRRELHELHTEGIQVPNDEAIVATTAGNGHFYTEELTSLNPDSWNYWHVARRAPIDDLIQEIGTEQIVHSAKHHDDFLEYLVDLWKHMPTKPVARRHAELALSLASDHTKIQFLDKLISMRSEESDQTR